MLGSSGINLSEYIYADEPEIRLREEPLAMIHCRIVTAADSLYCVLLLSVSVETSSGFERLIVEVSSSHTIRHTLSLSLSLCGTPPDD
jgi:hypothetical protein